MSETVPDGGSHRFGNAWEDSLERRSFDPLALPALALNQFTAERGIISDDALANRVALQADEAGIDAAIRSQHREKSQEAQPDGGWPSCRRLDETPEGDDQEHRRNRRQRHGEGRSDRAREDRDELEGPGFKPHDV